MVVTTGIVGYTEETTYGVRVDPADSQLRRFGMESEDWPFPDEKAGPNIQNVSSSFDPQTLTYGDRTVPFTHSYALIDAKELSYIGVVTSTDTTTPDYRHRITPTQPSQAYTAASRTVHAETLGEAMQLDIPGCLTTELQMSCIKGDPRGVMVKETFEGQRLVTDAPTHTLIGTNSGAVADPELSTGANVTNALDNGSPGSAPITFGTADFRTATGYETTPKAFQMLTSNTADIGGTITMTDGDTLGDLASGTDLTSSIKSWLIKVGMNYEFERPNRTGTNNYNQSNQSYIFGGRLVSRTITSILELDPDSTTVGLVEDSLKNTSNQEIYLKVEKSDDVNDWIVFALKPVSGTTSNVRLNIDARLNFKAVTNTYKLAFMNKDLSIIAGNEFNTLRSLSGT